ncbi:MAG: MCE family protein [Chrysiogenales bacterium]|nr:MAG: MCE family protein [Chrysiogenales bacterium]
MEAKFKNEVVVGAIFLVAMLILGYYTIIMSREFFEPATAYRMTVIFPNIEGLDIANKVKINGVEGGKVEAIQLRGHQVRVRIKMFTEFTLYENYTIKIKSDSLLGKKFVGIHPGTPYDRKGVAMAVVKGREDLPGTYEDAIGAMTELIDENRENIHASIRNIREITEKINTGQGTIAKLINDDRVYSQTDELIKELRETIEDAREQAPITSFIRAALTAF